MMVNKKFDDDIKENCNCECNNCCGKNKNTKKKVLLIALFAGGLVGTILGLKYRDDLVKAASANAKSLKKNKYVKEINAKKFEKLAKDFRKNAKQISKDVKKKF